MAFFLYPAFITFLKKTQILDAPDNRKIHSSLKPSMGGVPMLAGAAFAVLLWSPGFDYEFRYLIAGLVLMFAVGLRDDLVPLPANVKLSSQLIPFLLLIFWGDFKLASFYDILPGISLNEPFAWLLTIFVFIVITNSINLIDGLDGLAGSISMVILSCYGSWFLYADLYEAAYICFALVGGIIAFLVFNWQPSRIFMGDTGALTLGLACSAMTILFLNYNFELNAEDPAKISSGVATAICVMIIPLTDTLRVFIIRISSGRSPFSADTNHIHHLLLRCGFSHSGVVLILLLSNVLFIFLAHLGSDWPPQLLLMTVIICSAAGIFSVVLYLRLKTKPQKAAIQ